MKKVDDGTSRATRFRAGRELRRQIRRSVHGSWAPPKDRPDPVERLVELDRGRRASLTPIRYARMASSPFAFYRGAAGLMAADLSETPRTGLTVQLAGDAHVGNFGLFATPERNLVFDADDFDETLPGPWEWDLKRLGASLVLVARWNHFSGETGREAARTASASYRHHVRDLARIPYLDAWYSHLDLRSANRLVGGRAQRLFERELAAAQRRTMFRAFPQLARRVGRTARIRDEPPLIRHYSSAVDRRSIEEAFRRYRSSVPEERRTLLDRYRLVDVAEKVVGVGSVGTRCAIGLFLADPDLLEPLFLQVKEALPSVYEPYLGRARFSSHAERVVVGQRLVQEASDLFLGWTHSSGHDFYVRQLRDMRYASDLTALGPNQLLAQAELCGVSLARAHARTGDPAALAGYLGTGAAFDEALARFSEAYARQTERDHAELRRAVKRGRVATAG